MRAILSACAILSGLIVWSLLHVTPARHPPVVVDDEWREAYGNALSARKQILDVEEKAWRGEGPAGLKPEELALIGDCLKDLRTAERRLGVLAELLKRRGLEDCPEMRVFRPCWMRTKVWILDAADLVGPPPKPPESAGLYIRMNRAFNRSEKAKDELGDLRRASGDIQDRNDPAELEEARMKARRIRETLGACRTELGELEDYLRRELREADLSSRDLPDLEALREESSLLQQAMMSAREITIRFGR